MSIPIFFLFAIYSVVNTYLPLILRNMGYSATKTGFLLASFEVSGLVFPLIISSMAAKKGLYGYILLGFACIMIAVSIPLIVIHNFWITLLLLVLYAIGFKGAVPISDVLINCTLGENKHAYGRIRSFGSVGFVITALALQFFFNIKTASDATIILWLIIPAVLFALSILVVPKTLTPYPAKHTKSDGTHKTGFSMLRDFSPTFWIGLVILFFGFLGLVPANRFLALYVTEKLHIADIALLWAISASAEIPFMFYAHRFLSRFNTLKLIIVCLVAISIRNLSYIIFPSFGGAIFAQSLNAITYGVLHPAAVLFVSKKSTDKTQALAMSLYGLAAVGLAYIVGNALGGYLIDTFGYTVLFTIFSLFPLIGIGLYFIKQKKLEV